MRALRMVQGAKDGEDCALHNNSIKKPRLCTNSVQAGEGIRTASEAKREGKVC